MEWPRRINDEFEVGLMRRDEASRVVELYRAVYGDHYPIKSMYDPEHIFSEQEAGQMYRSVALDKEGRVVAQLALYRTSANWKNIYEEGQGMVLPEYRGRGLNNLTMAYDHDVVAPHVGMPEIWGEAVANHIFMQKTCISFGWYETGIELDLMPATSYSKSGASSGRVSSVLVFKTFLDSGPQQLLIPNCYLDIIQNICQQSGKRHQLKPADASTFSGSNTGMTMNFFDRAGVARLTILDAGQDFAARFVEKEQEMDNLGAVIRQVYLPLNRDDVSAIISVLRSQGYFFGGFLSRWFDHAGLMMQKLSEAPNLLDMNLYTDFSRGMLSFILNDREQVVA